MPGTTAQWELQPGGRGGPPVTLMLRDFVSPSSSSLVSIFLGSDSEAGKSRNKSRKERGTKLSDRTLAASTLLLACCVTLGKPFTFSEPLRKTSSPSHPQMGSNGEGVPRPEMLDQEMGHPAITQPPGQKFRGELDVSLEDLGILQSLGTRPKGTHPGLQDLIEWSWSRASLNVLM